MVALQADASNTNTVVPLLKVVGEPMKLSLATYTVCVSWFAAAEAGPTPTATVGGC